MGGHLSEFAVDLGDLIVSDKDVPVRSSWSLAETSSRAMQHALDSFNTTHFLSQQLYHYRTDRSEMTGKMDSLVKQAKVDGAAIKELEAYAAKKDATITEQGKRISELEGRQSYYKKLAEQERAQSVRLSNRIDIEYRVAKVRGRSEVKEEMESLKNQVSLLSSTLEANEKVVAVFQEQNKIDQEKIARLEEEIASMKGKERVEEPQAEEGKIAKLGVEIDTLKKQLRNPHVLRSRYIKTSEYSKDMNHYGSEGFEAFRFGMSKRISEGPLEGKDVKAIIEDLNYDDVLDEMEDEDGGEDEVDEEEEGEGEAVGET